MNNYFLVRGDGYGKSLPASTRNTYEKGQHGNDSYSLNIASHFPNGLQAEWGDAPDNLGYYIGVLATEYKLLKDNGQDVTETKRDLFYAINQINYMDACESHWPWSTTPTSNTQDLIDGFCVRGLIDRAELLNDIGEGVDKKFPNLHTNIPDDGTPLTFNAATSSNGLDDTQQYDHCNTYAMSVDHHSYLMLGLAMVVKYCDDVSYQTFLDGKTSNFATEAKLITARFWSYWYKNNWNAKLPTGEIVPIIPDIGDCPNADHDGNGSALNDFNHFGQFAGTYAYGFTKAAEEIVGGNIVSFLLNHYSPNIAGTLLGVTANDIGYDVGSFNMLGSAATALYGTAVVTQYAVGTISQNHFNEIGMNGVYQLTSKLAYYLMLTDFFKFGDIGKAVFLNFETIADVHHREAAQIMVIVPAFFTAVGASIPIISVASAPLLAVYGTALSINAVSNAIELMSSPFNWEMFYKTAYGRLHPLSSIANYNHNSTIESAINSAPCTGTYNYSTDVNSGSGGWANKRRWSAKINEQYCYDDEDGIDTPGTYAGLDYMFMFNLYCLKNDNYVDYEEVLTDDYVVSGSIPYVAVQPLVVGNFANIIGVDNYNPLNVNPLLLIGGGPLNLRTMGTITSTAVIEAQRAFDEDIDAPIFNGVSASPGSGIYNFIINWVNDHSNIATITIHLTTPALQSNVEFKGSTVILLPGFQAKLGSKFHAIAAPLHCNSSGTGYERVGNTNGSSSDETATTTLSKNNLNSKANTNNSVSKTNDATAVNNTDSEIKNKDFNIIPNPNSGYFTLVLPSSKGELSFVKITNMMGQTIFEKSTTENNVELNIEHLPGGVYSVTNTTNNISKTRKMVVH